MIGDVRTQIGAADEHTVRVRGFDLAEDLIGRVTFTEMALLAITGRRPSPGAVRAADAVLVTFVDHGLQPSALAARLTYHVGPEALQGAIAAGILGAGSRILGTMEQCGRLLSELAEDGEDPAARVAALLDAGQRVPGIGHALHRDGDPRAAALLAVAAEEGVAAPEVARLRAVAAAAESITGRRLPVNAAGASAALLLGIGIPWRLHRGIAIVSRAAGLVAHIGEEAEAPVTPAVRSALRDASRPGDA